MSGPVVRRRRYVLVDDKLVGWVIRRESGVFHAYILLPDLGCTVAAGTTRQEAADKAWSARCVLHSRCKPPTEETA